MQAESKQIVGLLGFVDMFLQFMAEVLVDETSEQACGVQGAVQIEAGC